MVRFHVSLLTLRVRETVTRLAHNQKIVGSTPTPATNGKWFDINQIVKSRRQRGASPQLSTKMACSSSG
jgi:hypothetical protein